VEDLVALHQDLIARFGGREGIRDVRLLESAAAMPRAGVVGAYVHADPFEMAAAYLFHLVANHPFVDGNKRVGASAALVFLDVNGIACSPSNDDLADVVFGVARGEIPKSAVAEFLRRNARRAAPRGRRRPRRR